MESPQQQPKSNCAWVTLATTDGYAIGALVLAHSLRKVGTRHKIHVLYTAGISQEIKTQLQQVFDDSTEVNVLDSEDIENLALIGRPDLGVTFTKLHCWRLTQYSKCVFLDADTFVVQNSDELFERPEFSAAPDIGWPDLFNSGVFVFVPSMDTYRNLLQFALSHGSFDGGDQGLLNAYFSGWRESDASHRLPFTYNVTTGAIYSYAAAMKKFAQQIKIIHFLGKQKPWLVHYEGTTQGLSFVSEFHKQWRDVYNQLVQANLPSTTSVPYFPSSQGSYPSSSLNPINSPFTRDPIDKFQYQFHESTNMSSSKVDTNFPDVMANLLEDINQTSDYSDDDGNSEVQMPQSQTLIESTSTATGRGHQLSGLDAWEAGIPDYMGADAFDNIQKAMQKSLEE